MAILISSSIIKIGHEPFYLSINTILVEHHVALVLCGQFLRQPDSPIAASRAGGSNDVGTVQFEQSALILRSLLRYHGGKWIAFHIRHQSQGYPCIAACRHQEDRIPLEQVLGFSLLDHPFRDAIFEAT